MRHVPIVSKSLAGFGYDEKRQLLELVYRDDVVHRFEKVPLETYAGLMNADRHADFVASHLYGRFDLTVSELES